MTTTEDRCAFADEGCTCGRPPVTLVEATELQQLRAELDRVRADLAAAHNHAHRQDTENQRLTRDGIAYANENARLRQRVAVADEEAAVRAFNDAHPIGTPVRYWKGAREGVGKVSTTRTTAQMLGGHTAVVWLDGVSGCIALTHIEPIATTAESGVAR